MNPQKFLPFLAFILGFFSIANAQPAADPTVTGVTTVCEGTTTTLTAFGEPGASFEWKNNVGIQVSTTAQFTPSISTITVPGQYAFFVTQTLMTGQTSASIQVNITVNPTPVNSVSATFQTLCSGQSTTLTAGGADSYIWTPVNQTGSAITVTPSATSTYTVVGTSLGCVGNSTQITITVNDIATITNKTICQGSTTTLTTSGADAYTWLPTTGLNDSTGQSVVASPSDTTLYTVTGIINATGCNISKSVWVYVNPTPTPPSITQDFAITSGEIVYLAAQASVPIQTYSWSTNFGRYGTLQGDTVAVLPNSTTTYILTVDS